MTTRKKIIISLLSLVIVLCIGICVPSVLIARAAECTEHDITTDYLAFDDDYHWSQCKNCSVKVDQQSHKKEVIVERYYHYWVCRDCAWHTEAKHTFASPTAVQCEVCEYDRAVIDYSGYEIGGLIKDFKITIPEDVKSIAYTEDSWCEVCVYNEKTRSYDPFYDFPNAVFLPNVNYYVLIKVAFDGENYYKGDVKNNLVIGGLGGAIVEQEKQQSPASLALANFNDTLELELILPKLGGVSQVQKISSLNYTVSGCELGSPVNQMQFTPVGDAVCDLRYYTVYKNGNSFFSDSSTNEVFDDSSLTKVELRFIPHDGYIFEGITEESFNIEGFGEIYDINILCSGSYLVVEYVLPSLVKTHTCDFWPEANLTYHWQSCGICGAIKDKAEHVYGLEPYCIVCDAVDYEHEAEIDPIVFEFSGYEAESSPANISITVEQNKYLDTTSYDYIDGYMSTYCVLNVKDLSVLYSGDSLALYTDYYLSIRAQISQQAVRYMTPEHFQLKGVGSAAVFEVGPRNESFTTLFLYFRLPQLTDESLVSSLNELNLTVKNFAVGNEISAVDLDIKEGSNPIGLTFYVNDVKQGSNGVITKGYPYELWLTLYTFSDYPIDLLEDFTKDKLTVNGADKLLSFDKYYDALGLYKIEACYSLVLDYEHEHNYQTIDYSAVAHWQLCDCGAASNIAEHNISLDFADYNFNYCSYCQFSSDLKIDSIVYTLDGYKIGNYGYELELRNETAGVMTWVPDGWVFRITDLSSALLGGYNSYLDDSIHSDTTYYLSIRVMGEAPFGISPNLIAKNITLKGYGAAKYYYYADGISSYVAVFELPKLELIHHIHGGLFVDEEISVCGTDTKINGYYQCTVCDKYFDKQNNEISLGHKFTKNWQKDDDKHWLECEVCGFKQNEEAHKLSIVSDTSTHGISCSVCGLKDESEHVYESASDNTCDDCGFKRIVIDYSGYCVDGCMADFEFTVSENAFGATLVEDVLAFLVGEDGTFTYGEELLASYFRPNEKYAMYLSLSVPNNFNFDLLSSACFSVAGVGGVVYDVMPFYGENRINVVVLLPMLGGVSSIKTVENLDLVVDGFEVNNIVNNINVTFAEDSDQATFNSFSVRVNGTSYYVNSQTDKVFESGTVVYIDLLFTPAKGYTFYGFTKEAITISGLKDFDIQVHPTGGVMYIEAIVDFRVAECEHDVFWLKYSINHLGTCSICFEEFVDKHVDNDDDSLCDVCGNSFSPSTDIYGVEATLQGYELDNKVSDVIVSLAQGTQGIDWENAIYGNQWIISTDVACVASLLSDNSGYFAPDQQYYLSIRYIALPGYTLSFYDKSNFVIKGIGEPLYFFSNTASAFETYVVYELPVLKGTSKIKPVGDITVDVSGYVYNGTVQDTSIEFREAYQSISQMNAGFFTGEQMQGTDVFNSSAVYFIQFELYPAEGYDFRNFTKENFTVNGVNGKFAWFDIFPNNVGVAIGLRLDSVAPQHTCNNEWMEYINSEYHQAMCSICYKIQGEQEAHNYVNGYCTICYAPYSIEINSITFKLEGYELGKGIYDIKLTTDCKYIEFSSIYGNDYAVYNTPYYCNYLSAPSVFNFYEDVFLHVNLVCKAGNVFYGYDLSEKDVVIEGLGAAELMIWGDGYYFVVFRLPKLEYPHNHGGTWIDEVPATCTNTGTKGYYECTVCGKYFDKQNAEIKDLTIEKDATKHNFGDWTAEVPATCTNTGTKGYYECSVCGKYFDEQKAEIADLTIEKDATKHNFGDWTAEVPATCTNNGTKGYYKCSVCGKYFDEQKAEIADLTIEKDPTKHNLGDWTAEVPATCTNNGTKGYYKCSVCGKYFDEQKAEIADLTIEKDATKHNFGDWIDEVPATTQNEGVKGHKDCLSCNKHFDADGNELLDLTIEKLGGDTPDDSSGDTSDDSSGDTPDDSSAGITDSSSGSLSDEIESCVSSVYSQSLIAMFVLAILVLVKSKRAKQN